MQVEYLEKGIKNDGTFQIEALSSENVKRSMEVSGTCGDNATRSTSTFTARWIGPFCGAAKKEAVTKPCVASQQLCVSRRSVKSEVRK
jgi:hypothetical protein